MVPNLRLAERRLIDQVDRSYKSAHARKHIHVNVHLLGLGMGHEAVSDLCLVQAFVFQGASQAVDRRGHIGFAEWFAECETHGRNRHRIARRLMESVDPYGINEKVEPHNKIQP